MELTTSQVSETKAFVQSKQVLNAQTEHALTPRSSMRRRMTTMIGKSHTMNQVRKSLIVMRMTPRSTTRSTVQAIITMKKSHSHLNNNSKTKSGSLLLTLRTHNNSLMINIRCTAVPYRPPNSAQHRVRTNRRQPL